ncbi:hypothetical protein DNTS_015719 [Danionella cerebrum]|uniref:Neurotrophin-4 n=1 Tax=Danionella cerebrum TaxID=2873325 RepID=A0A553QD23_9TELE|nr:hypothetical protein DNTS_015719 [Danionella translucida]
MHWLPLVAMVIASALPFPQSPVPRLVGAMLEPGRNDTNISSILLDETSERNSSFDTNHAASHKSYSTQSTEGRQEDFLNDSRTTGGDTSRSHTQRKYKSQKKLARKASSSSNDVDKDYSLEHRQFLEDSSIETLLKEEWTELSKLNNEPLKSPKEPLEISTLQKPLDESQKEQSFLGQEPEMEPPFRIGDIGLREEDQMLLLDAHPRVLFSPALSPPNHPPTLLMLELGLLTRDNDEESHTVDTTTPSYGGDKDTYRNLLLGLSDSDKHVSKTRQKRQVGQIRQGRELSVCEAESMWVTNRTTAVDDHNRIVTVLQEIQTQKRPLKQYFYETKCREQAKQGNGEAQGVEGVGCLGVDKKHWMSRCETKQSFVRALTADENMRIGWRWIRIDSSCVCVLLTRGNYNRERKFEKGREKDGRRNK